MRRKIIASLPTELTPDYRNDLVRIGSDFDGGYIIAASLLKDVHRILSFGLGYNWDFERGWESLGAISRIDCYDHTINLGVLRREYIRSVLKYFIKTTKRRQRIKAYRDYQIFLTDNQQVRHFEMMIGNADGGAQSTLGSALGRMGDDSDDIFLKCDIEGGEYDIADELLENAPRFRGIALEFHDLHKRMDEFVAIVISLRKSHFLDHVHVNNLSKFDERRLPSVVELSFSRRDVKAEFTSEFLAVEGLKVVRDGALLDMPNNALRPDVAITYV